MKKELFQLTFLLSLFLIASIISLSSVSADYYTNPCKVNISLINQDPYPAVPDNYVDVVFQVSGVESSQCAGLKVNLVPSYPFSTEGVDTTKTLPAQTFSTSYNTGWMIQYKLRVDKDALDGNSNLELRYGFPNWNQDQYVSQEFGINIKDSRTAFDAVIQEVSGSDVSIAIANTGKYTANSVIVRIPEQNSYQSTGTDGQMVGNLASGDYTLVSFTVSKKNTQTNQRNFEPTNQTNSNKLSFDIYYTDNIGERRIVNMALPVNMGNSSAGFARNSSSTSSTSSSTSYYWYILLAILIIGGFIAYKKHPDKVKSLFSKSKHGKFETVSGKVPDWIKNAEEKERKK